MKLNNLQLFYVESKNVVTEYTCRNSALALEHEHEHEQIAKTVLLYSKALIETNRGKFKFQ